MTSGANDAVRLKPNRDKPVRSGHPWIFSGAIEHIPPAANDGDIVDVTAADGRWLARGYLNRRSQIQVRLLTWAQEAIDDSFWRNSLAAAIAARTMLPEMSQTNALRLVNAENDGLPGLTVDRFADYPVMQVGTLAIDQRKHLLSRLLIELTAAAAWSSARKWLYAARRGLVPLPACWPERRLAAQSRWWKTVCALPWTWNAARRPAFTPTSAKTAGALPATAQPTQRPTAQQVDRVLNAFAYTGAFAVYALSAGPSM